MTDPASLPHAPRPSLLRLVCISPDGRLRAGWRLLLHGALLLLIALALLTPPILLLLLKQDRAAQLRFDSPEMLLVSSAVMCLATLAATWLARRLFDRRSLRSLGLALDHAGARDFLLGLGIAFCMMATIFLLHLAAGWLTLDGWGWEQLSWPAALRAALLSLALYLLVGFQEELLFRGYQMQNLIEGLNPPLGMIVSSLLFGLAHLGNPAASWAALLGITFAGLVFALAWLRTRSLWLAIGLHTGWNFFEGTIFGFPVSGLDGFHLIRHRVSGPVLLTGGAFGPEAGLVLIPGLLLAAYLIIRCTARRSRPVCA